MTHALFTTHSAAAQACADIIATRPWHGKPGGTKAYASPRETASGQWAVPVVDEAASQFLADAGGTIVESVEWPQPEEEL